MKRTKRMMLATLMATAAIAMLLMSRALAAPATCPAGSLLAGMTTASGTCPTSNSLNQLLGSCGSRLPVSSACPSAANLKKLLKNGSLKVYVNGKCASSDKLRELLGKYGIDISGSCTGGACPTAAPAPTKAPVPAPTKTPAPTPTKTPAPTTAPAPTPAPTVPPVTGSMSADESKMISLVNQDRAANGLPALKFDAGLRAAALAHSKDMSQNNYFSHTSPTYGDFSTRLKASGVKYSAAGENIAMYPTVEKAEVGFMNSPGHRANILNTSYTRVGIGIVYNQSKGAYYITQWFAK